MNEVDGNTLHKFRNEVTAIYGDNLDRVILFGSRARGDNTVDSDYDVAVFLKNMPDRWAAIDRVSPLRLAFLERDAVFFDVMPYKARKITTSGWG